MTLFAHSDVKCPLRPAHVVVRTVARSSCVFVADVTSSPSSRITRSSEGNAGSPEVNLVREVDAMVGVVIVENHCGRQTIRIMAIIAGPRTKAVTVQGKTTRWRVEGRVIHGTFTLSVGKSAGEKIRPSRRTGTCSRSDCANHGGSRRHAGLKADRQCSRGPSTRTPGAGWGRVTGSVMIHNHSETGR